MRRFTRAAASRPQPQKNRIVVYGWGAAGIVCRDIDLCRGEIVAALVTGRFRQEQKTVAEFCRKGEIVAVSRPIEFFSDSAPADGDVLNFENVPIGKRVDAVLLFQQSGPLGEKVGPEAQRLIVCMDRIPKLPIMTTSTRAVIKWRQSLDQWLQETEALYCPAAQETGGVK